MKCFSGKIDSRWVRGAMVVLLAVSIMSCDTTPSEKVGELTLLLTSEEGVAKNLAKGDRSIGFADVLELLLTVEEVLLEREGDAGPEFESIFVGPREVNLVNLVGISEVMAAVDVPAGTYTGIRIVASSARISFNGDPATLLNLELPDGGIFDFPLTFTVTVEGQALLVLDFQGITITLSSEGILSLGISLEATLAQERPGTKAVGEINNLDTAADTFDLSGGGRSVLVDYATALIFLPGDTDSATGTEEDLANGMRVVVLGTLTEDRVLVALAIAILPIDDDDEGEDDGMITICHRPPDAPEELHTIRTDLRGLPAHLAHGDTLGPCGSDRLFVEIVKELWGTDLEPDARGRVAYLREGIRRRFRLRVEEIQGSDEVILDIGDMPIVTFPLDEGEAELRFESRDGDMIPRLTLPSVVEIQDSVSKDVLLTSEHGAPGEGIEIRVGLPLWGTDLMPESAGLALWEFDDGRESFRLIARGLDSIGSTEAIYKIYVDGVRVAQVPVIEGHIRFGVDSMRVENVPRFGPDSIIQIRECESDIVILTSDHRVFMDDDDGDDRIVVCHVEGDDRHTVRIRRVDLPFHLAHGDAIGACLVDLIRQELDFDLWGTKAEPEASGFARFRREGTSREFRIGVKDIGAEAVVFALDNVIIGAARVFDQAAELNLRSDDGQIVPPVTADSVIEVRRFSTGEVLVTSVHEGDGGREIEVALALWGTEEDPEARGAARFRLDDEGHSRFIVEAGHIASATGVLILIDGELVDDVAVVDGRFRFRIDSEGDGGPDAVPMITPDSLVEIVDAAAPEVVLLTSDHRLSSL